MDELLKIPFKQGREDYRKGFSKSRDNPYMPGTMVSGAWRKGWEAEHEKNMKDCQGHDDA